jgi:hypothetical protein
MFSQPLSTRSKVSVSLIAGCLSYFLPSYILVLRISTTTLLLTKVNDCLIGCMATWLFYLPESDSVNDFVILKIIALFLCHKIFSSPLSASVRFGKSCQTG